MIKHDPEESNTLKPSITVEVDGKHLHVYDLPGIGLAVFLHDLATLLGYKDTSAPQRLQLRMGAVSFRPDGAALAALRSYSPALPQERMHRKGFPVIPLANASRLLGYNFHGARKAILMRWLAAIRKEMRGRHQSALASIRPVVTADLVPARAPAPKAAPVSAPESKAVTPSDAQIVDIDWSKLVSDSAPDPVYSVDFEYLWPFLGYSKKENALRVLKGRFVEGVEFYSVLSKKTRESKGRPVKSHWLTMNCAQQLCLVANTETARRVRRYFIAREAQAKRLIEERQEISQRQAAPAQQDPLAMVERGIALFERLGGVDERDRLFLRDVARNALAKSTGTPLLTAGVEPERGWTVGERIVHLGYQYSVNLAQRAGRKAAQQYRSQMGQEPPAVDRYVDGAVRPVKLYAGTEALALLDEVIAAEVTR